MKLFNRTLVLAAATAICLAWVITAQPLQQAPAAGAGQGQAPAAQGGGRGGGGGGRGGGAPAAPPAPAPRYADGKIRLSSLPGVKGLWYGDFGGGRGEGPMPFQPWSAAVFEFRRLNELEPHARCHPSGVVRQFQTPYGVDFVDIPESKIIYILDVGGPHTFRTIYMDGRPHPTDILPSAYGHSVGRWEGDTLVVDTVGFDEKFWLDRAGSPHTEKMRVTEKFTRTNMTSMRYEYTIDDPVSYTAPWTRVANIAYRQNDELFEYVCQDNNLGSELMVGAGEFVDRAKVIVP